MSSFLLEIGTEELPASFVTDAQVSLTEGLAELLRSNHLSFDSIQGLSTPRRIAALVTGLAPEQETISRRIKGPPVASSFSEDGAPKPAATGFAAKHDLTVDQLEREQQGDVVYLIANVVAAGKPAAEILQSILPRLVPQLSGERMMRWGSSDFKFSRPIRWIVSLLDENVVEFTVNGVTAGRLSQGHRILHSEPVSITDPVSYASQLRAACVEVDPAKRRATIESEVRELAGSLGGAPRQLSGSLLAEVVNITEWPKAVVGDFAVEYLDMPDALIETVMIHHQKYFPVEALSAAGTEGGGKLMAHFITVSNNDREDARLQIKQGNERVLRARLADGRFFYFDDQKTALSDRRHAVSQLTFQEDLGSYGDKVRRMLNVLSKAAPDWCLEAKIHVPLERTIELCKNDLVTSLVRELPELQGHVGSWYAEQEGQPAEVVQAIASHYAPRFTDDAIPADTVGQLASVLDKVDTLAGLFTMGKKPTGSSDPFALRRQAQGLVEVLMDGLTDVPVHLTRLLELAAGEFESLRSRQKKSLSADKALVELTDFVIQRIRTKLIAQEFRREVVDAALSATAQLDYLSNIHARACALEHLLGTSDGVELVRAGVRIANILKSQSDKLVNPALFDCDAERNLWQEYQKSFPAAVVGVRLMNAAEYGRALNALLPLLPAINKFFEDVMVNDADAAKRLNRHALLEAINSRFRIVADFSRLQPLTAYV